MQTNDRSVLLIIEEIPGDHTYYTVYTVVCSLQLLIGVYCDGSRYFRNVIVSYGKMLIKSNKKNVFAIRNLKKSDF